MMEIETFEMAKSAEKVIRRLARQELGEMEEAAEKTVRKIAREEIVKAQDGKPGDTTLLMLVDQVDILTGLCNELKDAWCGQRKLIRKLAREEALKAILENMPEDLPELTYGPVPELVYEPIRTELRRKIAREEAFKAIAQALGPSLSVEGHKAECKLAKLRKWIGEEERVLAQLDTGCQDKATDGFIKGQIRGLNLLKGFLKHA